MRLTTIRVVNFRSLKSIECTIGCRSTFLGPNNHGKSNILASIEFLLTPGMRLTGQDFFSGRHPDDNRTTVEGRFVELTEQERTTFQKYLQSDGSLNVMRWATLAEDGTVETGYHGLLEEPIDWWLQSSASVRLRNRDEVEGAAADIPELSSLLNEPGRITKDRIDAFQSDYIESHRDELEFKRDWEGGPLLGRANIAGGILPDFYLIPAVRDLADETRTVATTSFGRLLQRAIAEMTARDPRFVQVQSQLGALIGELNSRQGDSVDAPVSELEKLEQSLQAELAAWGVDVRIEVSPPDVKKLFDLGTELWIDDGHKTRADRKGHGLQRAILFSLVRAWSAILRASADARDGKSRTSSDSLLFAFEEPELYLHPQAQRTLAASLKEIAATPEHQVLICTHSTHFIDLEDYKNICIVRRPDASAGTQVSQCLDDLFEGEGNKARKDRLHMAAWINPDRGELFFARRIVLVEGETEKVLLPYLASRLGQFDPSVSIIDCGSKHNLQLYIAILNAFALSYVVIHDEDPIPDPVPREWSEDKVREKQRTFDLNVEIAGHVDPALGETIILRPDCEGFFGISGSQGGKKGKALAALDHFASKEADAISQDMRELVTRIFER